MRSWFDARSLREKRLLVVMAALLALLLVWLLIIRPLGDALSSEEQRHADAVIRLGSTAAAVDAIREARHAGPPLTGTLADTVRARAADAGFTIASLDEDGPAACASRLPARGRRHWCRGWRGWRARACWSTRRR